MGKLGLVVTIISIIIFTILWIKKREYLSLYIIFAMLFLPKINIIKISAGTTVGLRADDLLILLFVVVICFFERFKSCSKVFDSKIFKLFCLYLLLSTISALTSARRNANRCPCRWRTGHSLHNGVTANQQFRTFFLNGLNVCGVIEVQTVFFKYHQMQHIYFELFSARS